MLYITPTPGRVVWYYPPMNCAEAGFARPEGRHAQPLAAIVACVLPEGRVNLAVFDANGVSHSRTSVELVQDGGPRPDGGFCRWMPYQMGQAAKTEALEAAAKAA